MYDKYIKRLSEMAQILSSNGDGNTKVTPNRLQPCPKCGSKYRTIKVGVTQNKIKKQKWFCYACRRQFVTEINTHPSARTMNSSGVTSEQEMKED